MGNLLRALPLVALALAAVDTWLVRSRLPHREPTPRLFVEAFLIWSVFALVATLPARATRLLLRRPAPDEPGGALLDGVTLALWTALPVTAHRVLDAHTDLGGDLSGLASPAPWIGMAGLVLGAGLLLLLARRWSAALPARGTALGLGAVALAAGLAGGSCPGGARPADAASAAGAPGERPNVLLLIWDTTRSESLAAHGYGRPTTDWLSAFAEESIVFDRAWSASRFTLTSHLSMLTGTYPSHHGARMTRQSFDPVRTPSVASLLREQGYRTGGFVGTAVLAARTRIDEGFEVYGDRVDPPVCDTAAWSLVHDVQSVLAKLFDSMRGNGLPHWWQDFQRPAPDVLAEARRFIEADDGRPWFCMVNLYDVHWPYLPNQEARERWVAGYDGPIDGYLFRSDDFPRGYDLEAADDGHLIDLYDGELWQLDRAVAGFVEGLDLDASHTAVVVTSDHGEAFGEAEVYGHDELFEPQLRIPLMVRLPGPGAPRGERVSLPASGIDVAPTILGLAGIERPEHVLLGRDLLSEPPGPERVFLVEDRDHLDRSDVRIALYRGDWKLLRLGATEEEWTYRLHDLARDPLAEVDVSSVHPELVAELAGLMEQVRGLWGPDDDAGGPTGDLGLDALNALGYAGSDEDG